MNRAPLALSTEVSLPMPRWHPGGIQVHGPPVPVVSSQLLSRMQGGSADKAVPEIASLLKMFPTQPQQGHLALPSLPASAAGGPRC